MLRDNMPKSYGVLDLRESKPLDASNKQAFLHELDRCRQVWNYLIFKTPQVINMLNVIEKTLTERGTNYGDVVSNAEISQILKAVMHEYTEKLESIHIEDLDMIFHKIARILNGDPNYADSWHDIAGYAVLVEQYILKGKQCDTR